MPFPIKAKLNKLLHQAVEQLEQENNTSERDLTKVSFVVRVLKKGEE